MKGGDYLEDSEIAYAALVENVAQIEEAIKAFLPTVEVIQAAKNAIKAIAECIPTNFSESILALKETYKELLTINLSSLSYCAIQLTQEDKEPENDSTEVVAVTVESESKKSNFLTNLVPLLASKFGKWFLSVIMCYLCEIQSQLISNLAGFTIKSILFGIAYFLAKWLHLHSLF